MLGHVIPHIAPRRGYYATDFGDVVTGNMIGNGWSAVTSSINISAAVAANANSISGKRATIGKITTDGYRLIAWDRLPDLAAVEMLVLMQILVIPGVDETNGQLTARADPADGDPYYVCLPCKQVGTQKFEIGKGDGAGGGSRLGNVNKAYDSSNYWWIRFRLNGNSQKGKMWQFQTPEPTTWELDFADTQWGSAGRTGFGMYYAGTNYAVLWLSVAQGGNTAPSPGG